MKRLLSAARWFYRQPYLLMSVTIVFWSANTVIGRSIAGHLPPITFSFVRWIGGFIVILPFAARYLRQDWPIISRNIGFLCLLAASGLAYNSAMLFYGLKSTTAINSLILQAISPLLIAGWSFALYRSGLSRVQLLAMVIAVSGVLFVVTRGDFDVIRNFHFNSGDLWILGGSTVYGFHAAVLRNRPALHSLSFFAVMFFLAAVMTVPLVIGELAQPQPMNVNAVYIGALIYIILGPSIASNFLFMRSIDLIGPHQASIFLYLMPLIGAVMAMIFLGERPQLFHLAGFVLIIGGVILSTRGQSSVTGS